MPEPADQVAANIELMRSATDDFNTHNLRACASRISPDFIIHLAELPEPLSGRETWLQNAEMMQRAFPDLIATIDGIVASGDQVALRLTFTGTHAGDFLGQAPTGRTIRYVSHEFYRIEEGLLAEEWICLDTASLIQQIT
jgi:predicted ester cyclase